jgi:hypothetical protein
MGFCVKNKDFHAAKARIFQNYQNCALRGVPIALACTDKRCSFVCAEYMTQLLVQISVARLRARGAYIILRRVKAFARISFV